MQRLFHLTADGAFVWTNLLSIHVSCNSRVEKSGASFLVCYIGVPSSRTSYQCAIDSTGCIRNVKMGVESYL